MRRIWPIGVMIVGARMLLGSFMMTTVKGEDFFDYASTPIGLILVVVGGYFFIKDYE
jgi:ABC-type enterobactin transport system permease subunit